MELTCKVKYQEATLPSKAWGNNLKTTYSSWTSFKLKTNKKLMICYLGGTWLLGLNSGNQRSRCLGRGCCWLGIFIAPRVLQGLWAILRIVITCIVLVTIVVEVITVDDEGKTIIIIMEDILGWVEEGDMDEDEGESICDGCGVKGVMVSVGGEELGVLVSVDVESKLDTIFFQMMCA